jgi:hypothetical protein
MSSQMIVESLMYYSMYYEQHAAFLPYLTGGVTAKNNTTSLAAWS